MFPQLKGKKPALINLNDDVYAPFAVRSALSEEQESPFLRPDVCAAEVGTALAERGAEWGYGGYMENRSQVWKGLYLTRTGSFLHLGVDYYVPEGTIICADFPAIIHHVDHDPDMQGGWGGRVVLRPDPPLAGPYHDFLFIYAHLASVEGLKVGDRIPAAGTFASVGSSAKNGGWFPHLHVQMIGRGAFDTLCSFEALDELDGYARPEDVEAMKTLFPDPTQFLLLP